MSNSKYPQPVIVGCGYLGKKLSKLLLNSHQSPICLVKSIASYSQLTAIGLSTHAIDLDHSQSDITDLGLTANQIYYLAPPSSSDNKDHRIDHFLDHCKDNPPDRIVYISTSGVYGDCQGQWVSEDAPLAPISSRAKRRVYAEKSLIDYCTQHFCEYIILRVGGIYGPDRLPIQRLHDITVVCPEEAPPSNRIHVSDLAKICHAAMTCNAQNEVINVADGHPTSMSDYYYKIADFAELPRPPCVSMSDAQQKLSAPMLSFINESRRLSTKKMDLMLDVQLQFPTLESGLEDCFK